MHARNTASVNGGGNPRTGIGGGGPRWRRHQGKLVALALFAAVFAVAYFTLGDYLSLKYLAAQESKLRDYQQAHAVAVCAVAFLIYAAVTGLSLPAAAGLSMAYGWLFGFPVTMVIVSFASTTGATFAFLLSRYLLRDLVQQRFGERLASFNAALEREGAFYLFTLRLIPAVPFFVINVVMGLTPMRVWTFWWVSQLGMLAGTAVYVYAGTQLPSLDQLAARGVGGVFTPGIIAAFIILGLFPIVTKIIFSRLRPRSGEAAT